MYSNISTEHTHDPEKLCMGCFIADTLNTFQKFEVNPMTAVGILEFMKVQMMGVAEDMMNGLPPEADECPNDP